MVSRARAKRAAASRRVGAWTMTLAIMASKSGLTALPASTPESNLAPPSAEGVQATRVPGAGRKLFSGSSAHSRASMAQPFSARSPWLTDRGSPSAMRICSRTRSLPITASVTGCST